MIPRGSKAKRAAARQRIPPHLRPDFLKMRSVSVLVAGRHKMCSDAFCRWIAGNHKSISNRERLDTAMAAYCQALYFDGALPFEGNQCMYGFAFIHDLTFKGNTMVKT